MTWHIDKISSADRVTFLPCRDEQAKDQDGPTFSRKRLIITFSSYSLVYFDTRKANLLELKEAAAGHFEARSHSWWTVSFTSFSRSPFLCP